MKTLLVCESTHHGNTRKLVNAITETYPVDVIDAAATDSIDCSGYDCIGFASGIAFGNFYKKITSLAAELPAGKKVFFLYTCGKENGSYDTSIREIAEARGCTVLGKYSCKGFDTFGPLKLLGGLNKNHPDADEIRKAVEFYEDISKMI